MLSLRQITLQFDQAPLLDHVDLDILPKERLCLLGRNGMGKTTLFKIISGQIQPDSGEVLNNGSLVISQLAQDVTGSEQGTVYQVVARGLGEAGKWIARYHDLKQLNDEQQLAQCHHKLDEHHAWQHLHEIDATLAIMQLPADSEFNDLSGGLKRRVLLAKAMITKPDILLLDEPTNHLDIKAIEWLEQQINNYPGTVMFISHDRSFVKNLATRLVELDRGHLQVYQYGYEKYLDTKAHELSVEQEHAKQFDKKLAQEEAWIRQGIKARRTRNEGRVRHLHALREQRKQRRDQQSTAKIQLQDAQASGKIVIEAEHIQFAYENNTVVNDFSTVIMRGDKVGLIGPNGVGKTTLIQLLLGKLSPVKGTVKQGTKLKVAYFDQLRSQLDQDKSVADNVSEGDQHVILNGKSKHIMSYLQDFLFSPERARTKVANLSGGERNRLLLARLFSMPANLLVMDEPTNDLDMETLELLEELLIDYSGTLLLVSHDRTFLNNVVTSTMAFEGSGHINEYVGGYDDWLRQRSIEKAQPVKSPAQKPTGKSQHQQTKQIRALEQKITKLEQQQKQLHEALADPKYYEAGQEQNLQKKQKQLEQIEQDINDLTEQWEQLLS